LRKLVARFGARWVFGSILTILACAQVFDYIHINTLNRLDIFVYDLRVRFQTPKLDPRIVIVDIDEKSLTEIGHFPWGRNVVADLIRKLTDDYHVKVIGIDIENPELDTSSGYNTLEDLSRTDLKDIPAFAHQLTLLKPKLDYDELLAAALKNKPVVLGYRFTDEQKKGLLPAPIFQVSDLQGRNLLALQSSGYVGNIAKLQSAAERGGFFNAELDIDGLLRSSPLVIQYENGFYESLALATARVALGATTVRPQFIAGADRDYGELDSLILNTQPVEKHIPVDDLMKIQIDFRGKGGPEGGGYRYISATDVLHKRVPIDALDRRVVLIGTSAPGLNDLRSVPMNNQFPGVEAHANIIASILDGNFKHTPDYSLGFDFAQVVFVGLLLIIALSKLKPLPSILFTAALAGSIIWFNFWAYSTQGLILPVATVLTLIASLFMFNVAWGYWFEVRINRAMTNLFGEYVAPELVEVMAEDPSHYNMDGEKRVLTILFADVRGFTTISELLETNDLREFINIYLTAMSEDIRGNKGTLDKYIGDCVMAFWGAPVRLNDHASRAVATALAMLKTAERVNVDFKARGWPPLKIGIGLNTGEVRVGDMGSKIRRAYTVMGDAVNLSSRLEGITKQYGVGLVVGEMTKLAAPEFAYRELDRVKVKGKNEPVAIFQPVALASELDEATRAALMEWDQALSLFRLQQWDKAEQIVTKLHAQYPDQYLYKLYLEQIQHFRAEPPGPDWDGVTTYTTK